MAKNKLNNVLGFDEYAKLGNDQLKKKTKRTEVGGDVLNEHHRTTREGKLAYVMDNLDQASDELIDSFYDMLENELL
jgi:hypothetical protein